MGKDSASAYCDNVSVIDTDLRRRILSKKYSRTVQYQPADTFAQYADIADGLDPLSAAQYWDVKTYLAGDILTKVDRASMRHSLEVRVPFLDHEFVEWMATIPPRSKLKNGEGKVALKSAMRNRLPDEILYRRKQGFSTPLDAWFRGPLRHNIEDIVKSRRLLDLGVTDQKYIAQLGREHLSRTRNAGEALWSLAVLDASLKTLF